MSSIKGLSTEETKIVEEFLEKLQPLTYIRRRVLVGALMRKTLLPGNMEPSKKHPGRFVVRGSSRRANS